MAFRDIFKIINAYDKKVRLQQSNKEENYTSGRIKKPTSSLAFKQFRDGKRRTDVAINLEILAKKAVKLCPSFLDWKECTKVMNFIWNVNMIYQLYYQ